jgi:hypothetical protein
VYRREDVIYWVMNGFGTVLICFLTTKTFVNLNIDIDSFTVYHPTLCTYLYRKNSFLSLHFIIHKLQTTKLRDKLCEDEREEYCGVCVCVRFVCSFMRICEWMNEIDFHLSFIVKKCLFCFLFILYIRFLIVTNSNNIHYVNSQGKIN